MTSYVWGQAAWMPGRPDVDSVLSSANDFASSSADERPSLPNFPSRLMRATSMLTRMSASVAAQTLAAAEVSGNEIPAVFASALGEVTIALDQLEMMVTGDGKISPARFKNSVHNTSAGVFSIAFGNRAMSTSLAAGPMSVPYGILEAQQILEEGASHVLVVVGDERLPEPLNARENWPSFAAGWVLGRRPPPKGRPQLSITDVLTTTAAATPVCEVLREHPCQGAYRLLEAVHRSRDGAVVLGSDTHEALGVMVQHGEPSTSGVNA